jgi:putative transposase
MRRKAHVRFGGRSEETGRLRGQHRASLRSNFVKVRQEHRVVSMAVVIAVDVNQDGQRQVLGLDVGPSEDGAFWHAFLRSLVARVLSRVKLVPSEAHEALKVAISSALQGASWQRCCTHLMRNALALVPKGAQQMVAATIRESLTHCRSSSSSPLRHAEVNGGLPRRRQVKCGKISR